MNKSKVDQKPAESKSGKSSKNQIPKKSKLAETENNKVKNDEGILVETARKIETSSRVIGEKTVNVVEKVTDQTTEIAEKAYDIFKEGVSDAYDVSSKTMSDISKKAAKYIKKYEDTVEMKKLNQERDKKMQELGSQIFALYNSKSRDITDLLADDESQRILNDLDIINNSIVRLGRRIKRKI